MYLDLFEKLEELMHLESECDDKDFVDRFKSILCDNVITNDNVSSDLIDSVFLGEIKDTIEHDNVPIYFGKTLCDLKLVLLDDRLREHEICVKYITPRNLRISSINLPHISLQDRVYPSLKQIIINLRRHLESLSCYFSQMEEIDKLCTIMEPASPTFKDNYRRILIDDRTWLHVEVSPDGLASDVYLLGESAVWVEKLQSGLLSWDHDTSIVQNIMKIFDFVTFPVLSENSTLDVSNSIKEEKVCSICLCSELPDNPGVPIPFCQNLACGVYFHRICLFQWLVASSGGRPPAFGVCTGSCPACFSPITCRHKDY